MAMQAPWMHNRWRWMIANVTAWSVLACLFAVQDATRNSKASFAHVLLVSLASWAPCALLTPAIAVMATRFRFGSGKAGRAVVAHLLGAVAFVLVGGAMMGASEWMAGGWPNGDLLTSVRMAIVSFSAFDVLIYASIVAVGQAVVYAAESRHREVHEAMLLTQLAEARMHVLSSQLQPHFLFNTLNAISALVREEPHQAERLLAKLSDLLRHVLHDGQRVETSLSKELSFLEKYVELQEVRYGARLRVSFRIDPLVVETRVPHLLLQPLVENAIRHGTSRRASPGLIEVGAQAGGTRLHLFVRDNGVGIPESGVVRDGIGLSSTKARLRQLYGDDHSFTLERVATGGTECRISVPLVLAVTTAA